VRVADNSRGTAPHVLPLRIEHMAVGLSTTGLVAFGVLWWAVTIFAVRGIWRRLVSGARLPAALLDDADIALD